MMEKILFTYGFVGFSVLTFYLYLCVRYITSKNLREYLILSKGEKEGQRLVDLYTRPVNIVYLSLIILLLWPWVLKGYFGKE